MSGATTARSTKMETWSTGAGSEPIPKEWRSGLRISPVRVAMEAGTHSIWISEQLQLLGHEVIVANLRELRAISHSDRKSDQVDAEKLARFARLDPKILRPIAHRTLQQQQALTLIRARDLMVRLRIENGRRVLDQDGGSLCCCRSNWSSQRMKLTAALCCSSVTVSTLHGTYISTSHSPYLIFLLTRSLERDSLDYLLWVGELTRLRLRQHTARFQSSLSGAARKMSCPSLSRSRTISVRGVS